VARGARARGARRAGVPRCARGPASRRPAGRAVECFQAAAAAGERRKREQRRQRDGQRTDGYRSTKGAHKRFDHGNSALVPTGHRFYLFGLLSLNPSIVWRAVADSWAQPARRSLRPASAPRAAMSPADPTLPRRRDPERGALRPAGIVAATLTAAAVFI